MFYFSFFVFRFRLAHNETNWERIPGDFLFVCFNWPTEPAIWFRLDFFGWVSHVCYRFYFAADVTFEPNEISIPLRLKYLLFRGKEWIYRNWKLNNLFAYCFFFWKLKEFRSFKRNKSSNQYNRIFLGIYECISSREQSKLCKYLCFSLKNVWKHSKRI